MKSTQGDCITPSRKGKHINESERLQIEYWRIKGKSITEIATLLQRHRSTIHRELKRGTVTNKRSDLSEYQVYRAQRAQDDYVRNSGAGGPYLKLSWDSKEAKRLHDLMTINKLSPYAAIEIVRQENLNINLCARSLYNNIHQYNHPITGEQLPMKNKRKKGSMPRSARLARNNVKGESIGLKSIGKRRYEAWFCECLLGIIDDEAETFTPQLAKGCKQRVIYARRKQKAYIKEF